MTEFSEKTEKAIIDDMMEIQSDAKRIILLCSKCMKLLRRNDAGNINSWTPDWSEVCGEIIERYENMDYIMKSKRGRW